MRLEFMHSYDVKTQANSRITLGFNKRLRIEITCSPGKSLHSLKCPEVRSTHYTLK